MKDPFPKAAKLEKSTDAEFRAMLEWSERNFPQISEEERKEMGLYPYCKIREEITVEQMVLI